MKKTKKDSKVRELLDPRQKLCWESYINPKSKTFANAQQSALKAGYSEGAAAQITSYNWFLERCKRLTLLSKAEKVLEEYLDMNDKYLNDKEIEIRSSALAKIKQDTAKFVAERLGKDEGYSTRVEQTGKDGEPIKTSYEVKLEEIRNEYGNEGSKCIKGARKNI